MDKVIERAVPAELRGLVVSAAGWFAAWLVAPLVLGLAIGARPDDVIALLLFGVPGLLLALAVITAVFIVQGVAVAKGATVLRDQAIAVLAAPGLALIALVLAIPITRVGWLSVTWLRLFAGLSDSGMS